MSPQFAIWDEKGDGNAIVKSLEVVPDKRGVFWISGVTTFNAGQNIQSGFIVDTNSGGTLLDVYWLIGKNWWNFQERPAVIKALKLSEDQVFPFDWRFSIPLENDIFH